MRKINYMFVIAAVLASDAYSSTAVDQSYEVGIKQTPVKSGRTYSQDGGSDAGLTFKTGTTRISAREEQLVGSAELVQSRLRAIARASRLVSKDFSGVVSEKQAANIARRMNGLVLLERSLVKALGIEEKDHQLTKQEKNEIRRRLESFEAGEGQSDPTEKLRAELEETIKVKKIQAATYEETIRQLTARLQKREEDGQGKDRSSRITELEQENTELQQRLAAAEAALREEQENNATAIREAVERAAKVAHEKGATQAMKEAAERAKKFEEEKRQAREVTLKNKTRKGGCGGPKNLVDIQDATHKTPYKNRVSTRLAENPGRLPSMASLSSEEVSPTGSLNSTASGYQSTGSGGKRNPSSGGDASTALLEPATGLEPR